MEISLIPVIKGIINEFEISPSIALGYTLSAVSFGTAISSFFVVLLRSIRFSYAETIASSSPIRSGTMLLFLYLEVWK